MRPLGFGAGFGMRPLGFSMRPLGFAACVLCQIAILAIRFLNFFKVMVIFHFIRQKMHFYTAIIHNKLSSDYPMTGADRHEGHLTSRFASLLSYSLHFVQVAAANSE